MSTNADELRAAGRDLFHAVTALDRMLETDAELTHEQRVEVYRQAYLAQGSWLDIDPEAQTTPPEPAVEDPRDALLRECAAFFSSAHNRAVLRGSVENQIGGSALMLEVFDTARAALRAAGVEPTP